MPCFSRDSVSNPHKKTCMSPYSLDQLTTARMKRRRSVPAAMPVGSIFAIRIKSTETTE
jgi:hypothetical protein